ncbi:hypothetical protein TcWFU_008272 [Taenia crassiceps]|uniref:Uncharacterized protein n=1 Tax=Taenia crassiceps TaxID=6207 RepID=A0ABR4QJ56_9CEST
MPHLLILEMPYYAGLIVISVHRGLVDLVSLQPIVFRGANICCQQFYVARYAEVRTQVEIPPDSQHATTIQGRMTMALNTSWSTCRQFPMKRMVMVMVMVMVVE